MTEHQYFEQFSGEDMGRTQGGWINSGEMYFVSDRPEVFIAPKNGKVVFVPQGDEANTANVNIRMIQRGLKYTELWGD